ncbi:MAG: TetR family transcriptional regulator, partial [Pseudomonadota bacterium]
MAKPRPTKEKLLGAARDLFWTRGYSNVSVRDITGAAGVDAALVSRYFGGKRG